MSDSIFQCQNHFALHLLINDAIRTRRLTALCLCTLAVSVLDGKQTSSAVSDIPIALFASPHRWHHISHDANRKLSQLNLRALCVCVCVIYNANARHNFIKSDLIWCVRTYLLPYHFAHLATTNRTAIAKHAFVASFTLSRSQSCGLNKKINARFHAYSNGWFVYTHTHKSFANHNAQINQPDLFN